MRQRMRRPKREGVASTVGTIMALLVFLTFLSLIVNQYVPVWMKDSEAAHMNVALGQISDFKSSVDLQMLSMRVAQQSRTHHIPLAAFTPVALGIDGVPIFSSPTVGTLESRPNESPWSVEFRKNVTLQSGGSTTYSIVERSSGTIQLTVPNRYYVPQALIYENGAVIKSQGDGDFVRVEPPFSVLRNNQSVEIGYTLYSLFGASSLTGTSTEGIHHKVIGDDVFAHEDLRSDVFINATTRHGLAWYNYFNKTLAGAYDVSGIDYQGGTCSSGTYRFCRNIAGGIVTFVWVRNPFYYVSASWVPATRTYTFNVQIFNDVAGTNPTVPTIVLFALEHGYVNTAVGTISAGGI